MSANKTRKYKSTASTRAPDDQPIMITNEHEMAGTSLSNDQLSPTDSLTPPLDNTPDEYANRHQTRYGSNAGETLDSADTSPSLLALTTNNAWQFSYCCSCFNSSISSLPKHHIIRLIQLAFPSMIGGMLSVCMNIINLAFVGHLSPSLLAGAALGNAFMLITGYTVLLGLNSSIDTLCSQAYGAHQHKLVGLIAQRAALAYTFVLIPITLMWCFTEQFFLLAGQDANISFLAGEYVWYCIPTIFSILYGEVIKRYLQAQSIMAPQIWIAIVANIVHAIVCYLFLYQFGLGLHGASFALTIGNFTLFFGWVLYLRFINGRVYRRTCPRLNFSALMSGWGPLYSLGLPGMLMLMFEWMSFEICAIGAGWMGAVQLDTMIVFSNLCTFLTMVPNGVSISSSTLVGHALGGGRPEQAKLYARAAGAVIVMWATIEVIILTIARNSLSSIFTADVEVAASFRHVVLCVLLFVLFDCFQSVESGVMRGLGLQSFGAKSNLFIYYLWSLPVGFLLAFYFHLGVVGLVSGLVLAVLTQTIVFFLRLRSVDWEEEAMEAQRRMDEERPEDLSGSALAGEEFRGESESESDDDLNEQQQRREEHGFIQ